MLVHNDCLRASLYRANEPVDDAGRCTVFRAFCMMEFDEPLVCVALKSEIKNARDTLDPLDVDVDNDVVVVSLLA